MKEIKIVLGAMGRLLVEFIILLPFLYIMSSLIMDGKMIWGFILELYAFGVVGILSRRLIRIPALQIIVGLLITLSLCLYIGLTVGKGEAAPTVVPMIFGPLVCYRGKLHAQNPWDAILPPFIPCFLLIITFLTIIFVRFTGNLGPMATGVTILGPIALLAGLFTMNNLAVISLQDDARARTGSSTLAISKGISAQSNILLVILTLLGVFMTSGKLLLAAANYIAGIIWKVLYFFYDLIFVWERENQSGGSNGQSNNVGFINIYESPSKGFWDKFCTVLCYITAAFIIVFLLWSLFRLLKNGFKGLFNLFQHLTGQGGFEDDNSLGFEDTRESLVNLRDLPKMFLNNARDRLREMLAREPRWTELSVTDKVRYLYRHTIYKAYQAGYHHNPGYTVRESLAAAAPHYPQVVENAQELAADYDLIRYAEREPDAKDVEALKEKMKL